MQTLKDDLIKKRHTESYMLDDISLLVDLTRLICLSEGESTLNMDYWKRACCLERQRKSRFDTSSK